MMADENWRPIVGYEGIYEISDNGQIKSLVTRWPSINKRILKHNKTTTGHHIVHLYKNKKRTSFLVHRLVATAFLEPSVFGFWVNHKDGNKDNNTIANLEWVTPSDNNIHALKTGLRVPISVYGEANPNAKLSRQQVIEIRSLRGIKSQRELGRIYGVCKSTIGWIHQDKHWQGQPNGRKS